MKPKADVEAVYNVLRKYLVNLKDQFLHHIGTDETYPNIGWLDFSAACQSWGILDAKLTSQDIDRLFIATNFEEEDLEDNDNKALCRYEFFEIIVRLAKLKFVEKGFTKAVSEATEKLIVNFIIPNFSEKMPNQAFRTDELWTLDVDDLVRKNMKGVEGLYAPFATLKVLNPKPTTWLSKNDCCVLMDKSSE